jgi:hypothetical protein
MDISAFQAKLNGLLNEISNLPAGHGRNILLLTQKVKPIDSKLKSTESLDESIDHLRLIMKYLMFDAEASRRENSYLRKMLENQEE